MKKVSKKDVTNEDLAQMVANGFSDVHKRIGGLDVKLSGEISSLDAKLSTGITEVREIIKNTRQSVLTIGDKFVPRYEFDTLLSRVVRIEQKLEGKHK